MTVKSKEMPCFERLSELLKYDPKNGELRWRFRRPGTRSDGIAGNISTRKDGRKDHRIRIDDKLYLSPRIIWMLYYHEDPGSLTIDHIDRDPLNNRISNLRLATTYDQNMNKRCTSPSTATRYIGLSMQSYKNSSRRCRPRWCGNIWIAGHNYSFGSVAVDTIDDEPPRWLVDRAARLYALRDDPDITDDTLIDLIKGLKGMPPVAPAAEYSDGIIYYS